MNPVMSPVQIDPKIYQLYDEYCHGGMDRREFLAKASAIAVGGLAMAQAMFPRYVNAQTVSFTDTRIKAQYVTYPSPGGNSGQMRAYLVQPVTPAPGPQGKTNPAVMVIHENRGLNPYVEDVARRLAAAGFLAMAPDGLHPVGGYPGNDDQGRELQASLNPAKLQTDMLSSAVFLKNHALSSGHLGVTGFCWGGGITNFLAAELGADMKAGAPYYGEAAKAEKVAAIRCELLLHFAENDPRINAQWPAFQSALEAKSIKHLAHVYAGTQHGFHNNSTPRYVQAAAELSWSRTLEFFKKNLMA